MALEEDKGLSWIPGNRVGFNKLDHSGSRDESRIDYTSSWELSLACQRSMERRRNKLKKRGIKEGSIIRIKNTGKKFVVSSIGKNGMVYVSGCANCGINPDDFDVIRPS